MRTIFFLLFLIPFSLSAQSHFLILKKRGRQVRLYVTGSDFSMRSVYGERYDGTITRMQHDSVFINGIPFSYKEIAVINDIRATSGYLMAGTAMMVAAGGILVLGPVNGLYRKDKPRDYYSKSGLITAGALAVAGYALRRSYFLKYRIGRKYSLQFLDISNSK